MPAWPGGHGHSSQWPHAYQPADTQQPDCWVNKMLLTSNTRRLSSGWDTLQLQCGQVAIDSQYFLQQPTFCLGGTTAVVFQLQKREPLFVLGLDPNIQLFGYSFVGYVFVFQFWDSDILFFFSSSIL